MEAALMMPWLAFLFVGVLDFGFYSVAAIATQNAARAVAIQVATQGDTSSTFICAAAKNELLGQINVIASTGCQASLSTVDAANPIWVCVGTLSNTASSNCGQPSTICADCALNAGATSIQAVVAYQGVQMVPIPGVLMGTMRMTRVAEARVIQ